MTHDLTFTEELIAFVSLSIDKSALNLTSLQDVLSELAEIIEEANHPDAVTHAENAIKSMALLWLTSDEIDARYAIWCIYVGAKRNGN